jgi:hypothetical protein
MTHNDYNYSFLYSKNFYTVIRIPPKYVLFHDSRQKEKENNEFIMMSYETYKV